MKINITLISLLFIPVLAFAQAGLPAENLPKAGLTPESPFYFLDTLGETLREFFTFNPESKARLQITFAAERVAEIKVILETKGVKAKGLDVAQSRLRVNLARATTIVADQKSKGKDISKLARELDDVDKEREKFEKEKKRKEEQVNEKEYKKEQEEKQQESKAGEKRRTPQTQEEARHVPYYQENTPAKTKGDEKEIKVGPEPQKIDTRGPSNISSPAQQFAALEKELTRAQASGFYLSPEHSSRIQNDLTNLENQNYDAAEIKRLRAIVLKLSPHVQDQSNVKVPDTSTGSLSNSVSQPAPEENTTENKPSGKPIVIKNLGVSFEPWNKSTNRAGAFLFLSTENKLFLEYGAEVQGPDGPKILPTFEYRTAADADVFVASDGIITKIEYQPQTQDYEILIQPEMNSEWTLGHDHVSNIKVFEGDTVKAGDVLGKAGTLGGALGRTEIMVWGSSANRVLTYCPFKLFAPELLSEYQQKVSQHMKDWEEFKGNPNLYAEEKHLFAGCLQETILDQ